MKNCFQMDRISQYVLFLLNRKALSVFIARLGLYDNTTNFNRHVKPLILQGLLRLTIPDLPSHRSQQYKTTLEGERYLKENFTNAK